MAKTKRKWLPLRVIQSNLLFRLPLGLFLDDLVALGTRNPDLLCLNEVSKRRTTLAQWAKRAKMHIFQPEGPGEQGGTALFAKASRFVVLKKISEAMTGEPPGAPSKRYATCMILWDRISHCFIIYIGTHTVAAVERQGKLNPIPRTAYYIQHIYNLITFAVRMRRLCKKEFGGYGQVILSGDFNWNFASADAWINKTLGAYFTSCHSALGAVATLGRRAVDAVLKRANLVKFKRQQAIPMNSDHDALVVDCEIGQVPVPPYIKQHPSVLLSGGL